MPTEQPAARDFTSDSSELLRAFLAARNVPCPQCGYNLRDLHGERCPECGEKLVLRVNLAEPKQGLLIAGLVGLSAGAGLNGLLLIYFLIVVLLRHQGGSGDEWFRFLSVNAGGFLIEGSAIWLWIAMWRRIRRLPTGTRSALMLGCWGLTLTNIVVFSLVIK